MKNIIHCFLNKPTGWVLGLSLLGGAAGIGCANHRPGWAARQQEMPYQVEPYAFLAEDDYTYYPQYETYYSNRQHKYAFYTQGAWMLRPSFTGVPLEVLLASPSVKMTFHDDPANHHAQMLVDYPRTWTAPVAAVTTPVVAAAVK